MRGPRIPSATSAGQPAQWSLTYLQVTGSTVDPAHGAVLMGGESSVGSETEDAAEAYGAPGVVFRPRPPEVVELDDGTTETLGAESYATRRGDSLVPITWRDLRFNRVFPAPKAGTVALVGYGGGFLSFDDTAALKGSVTTLYCPYAFSGDVPAKAHVLALDPTSGNASVSMVHGEGHGLLLTKEGNAILKNAAGDAYLQVGADGVTFNGNVVLNGGATLGDPVGALPATIAPHLISYLTALETLLGALATTLDAKLAVTTTAVPAVAAFVSATAALKAAMPATKTSVA